MSGNGGGLRQPVRMSCCAASNTAMNQQNQRFCHSVRSMMAGRALRATRALPGRNQSKTVARRPLVANLLANSWIGPGPPSCTPRPQPSGGSSIRMTGRNQRPQVHHDTRNHRHGNAHHPSHADGPSPGCLPFPAQKLHQGCGKPRQSLIQERHGLTQQQAIGVGPLTRQATREPGSWRSHEPGSSFGQRIRPRVTDRRGWLR